MGMEYWLWRCWEFLTMVYRPHFQAYAPLNPWWERWTKYLVGPSEAWMLADLFARCRLGLPVSGPRYPTARNE